MSRPAYLAVELDAKKQMPQVARAAGVDVGAVCWGLMELWEHVFIKKSVRVSRTVVEGCFGQSAKVIEALVEFGFLAHEGEGFRVKGGAEKILRIRAAQSAAGKANAGNLNQNRAGREPDTEPVETRPGKPADSPVTLTHEATAQPAGSTPALTPNTQHPTPLQKGGMPPPRTRRLVVPDDAPPKPEDKFATSSAFWSWFQAQREGAGLVREKPPHPSSLGAWWSEALGELQGDGARLEAGAFAYAEDRHWQAAKPPVPFVGFMSQWRNFVPQAVR